LLHEATVLEELLCGGGNNERGGMKASTSYYLVGEDKGMG